MDPQPTVYPSSTSPVVVSPQMQSLPYQPTYLAPIPQSQESPYFPNPQQQFAYPMYPPQQGNPIYAQPPQPVSIPSDYGIPTPPPHEISKMRDVPLETDIDAQADMTSEQAYEVHYNFEEHKHLDFGGWFKQGWDLYKEHWAYYSVFELAFWIIYLLTSTDEIEEADKFPIFALLGGLLGWVAWPLRFGYFVAGANIVRHRTETNQTEPVPFVVSHLFRPFYVYFPLLWLLILYGLAVTFGLICFIIPGLYFGISFAFAPLLYLENHHLPNYFDPQAASRFGILDAFSVSRRVVTKYFFQVLLFFLVALGINLIASFLIILPLVTLPVTCLASVFAYRDLFGLQPHRGVDTHCFCCR
jgi:hypothetical protein